MSAKLIKVALLVVTLIAIAIAFVRYNQPTLPEGPVPVVWDGEVCANCKMHVGDPRFAAQLQTPNGAILNFDDPGCLFDYLHTNDVRIHALYFRNSVDDGWLSEAEVGFLPAEDSPMGYGLRAVPKQTSGAHGMKWAHDEVKNRANERGGGT